MWQRIRELLRALLFLVRLLFKENPRQVPRQVVIPVETGAGYPPLSSPLSYAEEPPFESTKRKRPNRRRKAQKIRLARQKARALSWHQRLLQDDDHE